MSKNRVLSRRWFLGIAFLGLLALIAGCSDAPAPEPAVPAPTADAAPAVTTVYVVRHAEKEDGDDPSLTIRGRRRAQALAEMLGDDDIAAVFATEYLRTQQTVEPLAKALGYEVTVSPAGKPEDLARSILSDNAGTAVVAAAHSNTVPRLLAGLGVRETIEITDSEYGDLFVVVVDESGTAELTRHRFGD